MADFITIYDRNGNPRRVPKAAADNIIRLGVYSYTKPQPKVQPTTPATPAPTQQQSWQPSAAQTAQFQQQVADFNAGLELQKAQGIQRINDISKGSKPGASMGELEFNPQSGQIERRFYTVEGDKVNTPLEQSKQNAAYNDWWEANTLEGRLHRNRKRSGEVQTRLQELYRQKDERDNGERGGESGWDKFVREVGGAANSASGGSYRMHAPTTADKQDNAFPEQREIKDLMAESLLLDKERRLFNAALNYKKSGDPDKWWSGFWDVKNNWKNFWGGVGDKLADPSFWSTGLTDAHIADRLSNVSDSLEKGTALSKGQGNLMEAAIRNNMAESEFNGPAMFRFGQIGMESVPFMIEFALTGGLGNVMQAGAKAGTKLAAKAAEKWALNNFKKKAIQYTGTALTDFAIGLGYANTTGAMRTYSDIANRHMGQAMRDEDGKYMFGHYEVLRDDKGKAILDKKGNEQIVAVKGGETLGKAIFKGEVANALEYYTEMLGTHLSGKVVNTQLAKGAEKMGLSKVGSFLTKRAAASEANATSLGGRFMQSAGINGYAGEVMEEEANIVLNSLLVGDNKFSDLWDGRTQADIWGGMLFSVGVMEGMGHGLNAAQFHQAKRNVNNRDRIASLRLTEEKWQPWRERIKNATNETMTDVAGDILNSDLNPIEKQAALNYVGSLVKFRGFNQGSMVEANNQVQTDEDGEPVQTEVSRLNQSLNASYTDGYNASSEDWNTLKRRFNYLSDNIDGDLRDRLNNSDDLFSELNGLDDDRRNAALDYLNAQQAYLGAKRRVRDDAEDAQSVFEAEIDKRTNTTDANNPTVQRAVLKLDDQEVYILGGNVRMMEDGTMVDSEKSDNFITIYNPATGKTESTSPGNILSVDEPINKEDAMAEGQAVFDRTFRNGDNTLNGVLPFNLGDQATLYDEKGQPVTGVIASEVDADGMVAVTLPDGATISASTQELQSINDELMQQQFIAEYEAAHNQNSESEQPTDDAATNDENNDNAPAAPKYGAGKIVVRDAEGNEKRGILTGFVDEDGKHEYYLEGELNKLHYSSEEELDAMLVNYVPEKSQGPRDKSQERADYALNDELTLRDENGNPVRAEITASANEDGKYEVSTDSPVNGKRVNLYSRDELDAMRWNAEQAEASVEAAVPDLPEETEQPTQPIEATTGTTAETTENVHEPTPLQRIPRDESGSPAFEQADSPETAWDALVEYSEGDAATAKEIADAMTEEKRKAFEKAETAEINQNAFLETTKSLQNAIDGGGIPNPAKIKKEIADRKKRLSTLNKGAATGITDIATQRKHEAAVAKLEGEIDGLQSFLDSINKRIKESESTQAAVEAANAEVNTEPTPAQAEAGNGYSVVSKPYTNKQGKTLDTYLVSFDRDFSKEEMSALRAKAKALKGWYDRETKGWMLRSQDDAKAFAEDVIGKSEDVIADEAPLSLNDVEPVMKKVDVSNVADALRTKGKTKLSGHAAAIESRKPSAKGQEVKPRKKNKWISDADAAEFASIADKLRKHLNGDNDIVEEEGALYGHKKSLSKNRLDLTTPPANAEVTSSSSKGIAKLQTINDNLNKLSKKYAGKTDKKGVITDFSLAVHADRQGYSTIVAPNGNELHIRISNHNANAVNFANRGHFSGNISIVFKNRQTRNGFKPNDDVQLTEYVYTTEAIRKDDNLLSQVAESLRGMIETGEYVDLSGKAIVNHSPINEVGVVEEESTTYGKPQPKEMDAEVLRMGTRLTYLMMKGGLRNFADYAEAMVDEVGDAIRPHLKSLYAATQNMEEVMQLGWDEEMDDRKAVKAFDVYNFDKPGAKDIIATAQHIVDEQASQQKAEQIIQDIKDRRNDERRTEADHVVLPDETVTGVEQATLQPGEDYVKMAERIAAKSKPKKNVVKSDQQMDDLFSGLFNFGEETQKTENQNGRQREDSRTDNRGTRLGRKELSETEQVGTQHLVENTGTVSQGQRRDVGNGGRKLGDGPRYDVSKDYSNEEIHEIASSVATIQDGKVVLTGEVTDDIKTICRRYKSGGVAKKGRGVLDEYYTDGKIVEAVGMLIAPYFKGKPGVRALEPSVGIGNFLEALNGISTSEVVSFEINETTARIAKIQHPEVEVNLRSFETEFIDDEGRKKPVSEKYGLVIGNPPYGSHRGYYKGLGEESKIARYEDYFVKRSLDVLEEGGVLAMVLPSTWTDRHTKYGGYTIETAYRLPSGAFESTQVGTDIVVLKKDNGVPVEEHAPYFEQHPENICGEVKQRKNRFGKEEDYVSGDIDAAIEKIGRENAKRLAEEIGVDTTTDNLNDIEAAIEETGDATKAQAVVKAEKEAAKANAPKPARKSPVQKTDDKSSKYKVKLHRETETVPTSLQFEHAFSEGEVEAFEDADYDGTLNNPSEHSRYANYIGGKVVHDFYYAEGDIYNKLEQLERDKRQITEKYGKEQYDKQKKLLEDVLPKRKGISEITLSPNTTFVKNLNISTQGGTKPLREMFLEFCNNLPYQAFGDSSNWEVRGYVNNEQVYGQDKERNQFVRERRKKAANDLFAKYLNEELTDAERSQVVYAFNREYNSTYRPDYSKVPMFSTINKDFHGKPLKLTSVQLAGVGRMTVKGVGVLAHEVGFGKTLSGVLAMHEAMTRGFAQRPLIVVPNDNILQQWVETINEALPEATVNVLGNLGASYDLTGFSVEDGEFTIVTYEGLKAMSFSDATYNNLADRFTYITDDLTKHQSERDVQKEIEKRNELRGKLKRGTKATYGFEDFGFDFLTFDEVHNANHIVSKVRLDKSIASDFRSQSQRTSELGIKTWIASQYIQDMNNGRNVLLLSATPFTNKPLEYYSILSLVGNDMLKRKGFFNVDQFFSTFMEADNDLEIGANGRPIQKTNVRRFRNNGLFQQLLSEFIDIKGEEDNPDLVRPERKNKEYRLAQNDLTTQAMDAVQDMLGSNDTVLQGIGHARAAAFSPYATSLLGLQPKDHKEFVENSPKIDATIRMIEQNREDRPDAGQIIYSEVGVEFFPMIRDYLVKESGFKANEVRIITGATSNAERVNIQTAFNKGDVKVVIGSPAIKEGLNLQGNTTDMYILSLPWNFTQLRQIEGRGWRQGNKWENIRINYMLTDDSVDVFMLQRLQTKQGLYNEAMKSGAESLDVSDIDTAELKTALITDPSVRAEIVTIQERRKLNQEKTRVEADLAFVQRKYKTYNEMVKEADGLKSVAGRYKEYAEKQGGYWENAAKDYERKFDESQRKIEQEKQNLLNKGVNVDDIERQTEQARATIEAIDGKIKDLETFQRQLTEKYTQENAEKVKARGDVLSTYLTERKKENQSGFYKIRPKKDGTRYRDSNENIDAVNKQFNEELGSLTEANADRVTLMLGEPSEVLLAAGVEGKPMKLYGNKVIKKMKKHGFALDELRDLPKAVADPIAVFDNYGKTGNRSILTDLPIDDKHILVSLTIGKDGVDADFNIVSSVFGKGRSNITDWINKGYATYINKEKALRYLNFSKSSILEASNMEELSSAAKVIQKFENPIIKAADNAEEPYDEYGFGIRNAIANFESSYETQEGKTIRYTSEAKEAYGVSDTGTGNSVAVAGPDGVRRKDNLRGVRPESPLEVRDSDRLKAEGGTCRVERIFTERGNFDFTAGERIESPEDVAFIFSELENESVENSFAVYLKDGKATVLYMCTGDFKSSQTNIPAMRLAMERIEPDEIYFVHNHPSGKLEYSAPDINFLKSLKESLGIEVKGIIMNLRSGKFGMFDTAGTHEILDKKTPDKVAPIKIYAFNKQVFEPDFDITKIQLNGPDKIAAFLTSHRVGDRSKISLLVLNRNLEVVANVPTQHARLDSDWLAEDIVHAITVFGGSSAVIYGDFDRGANSNYFDTLNDQISQLTGHSAAYRVVDVIKIEGNHTKSLYEGYVFEPEMDYGDMLFRLGDEQGTFAERQRRAVENRGTVMPGLNEAEVNVVEMPSHRYNGEKPLSQAVEAAKRRYNGKTLHYDNFGAEFNYEITPKSLSYSGNHSMNSDNIGVHAAVMDKLDKVIGESIEVMEHADVRKIDGKRSESNGYNPDALMHRLVGAVSIDGKTYRVITTLKEVSQKGNRLHTYEVTKIEVLNADASSTSNGSVAEENPKLHVAKLLKGTDIHNKSGEKILQESAESDFGKAEYITDKKIGRINARQQEMAQTSAEAKTSHAGKLAQRLNIPIRIVNDPNEITDANAERQLRMQGSKGWYNLQTGEVVVNIAKNADVQDVAATIFHEVVAHKGLRELVGEENYGTFLQEVYTHATEDVRRRIVEKAARHGYDFEKATDEYLGDLAEKGFEEFTEGERSIWQKLKQKVLDAINKFLGSLKLPKWVKLGDNELRYMLWRSHERLRTKGDYVDMARDVAKREELGLGGHILRESREEAELRRVNARFNEQLERYQSGELKANEILRLGMPTGAMVSFLPKLPMVMRPRILRKASETKHNIDLSRLTDLPGRIANPIFVFQRSDNAIGILTEIKDRDGKNVCVAIELDKEIQSGAEYLSVNDVRSLHGRDAANVILPILHNHTLKYANKEKGLSWLSSASSNYQQEIATKDLDDAAKVIKNFENPAITTSESELLFRDDETDDIWKDRSVGLEERITNAAIRLSNNQSADLTLRNDAKQAVTNNLQSILHSMRNRRGTTTSFKGADRKVAAGITGASNAQAMFDRATVKRVSDLARILMQNGYLSGMTSGEMQRLLSAVKNATAMHDISESVQKIMDIMVNNQLRNAEGSLRQLLAIRGSKVEARGVEVQGVLDVDGQRTMEVVKKAMSLSEGDIIDRIADALNRMSDPDNTISDQAAIEYAGLNMALDYVQNIANSKAEEKALRDSLKTALEDKQAGRMTAEAYKQFVEATEDAIRKNKIERAEACFNLVGRLSDSLRGSIENAKAFREAEKARINEIHHNANSDMEGRKTNEHHKDDWKDKVANNGFVQFLFAPLGTFDQILRIFGNKSANGEGYLWNRFMRGWVDCRNKELQGVKDKFAQLDVKAAEIFGKGKTWGDVIRMEGNLPKASVSFWDGGELRDHELTQGNLLYIYMVDKMTDGRMKLRRMGITEQDISNIENFLDPRFKAIGDWLQDEFLVATRNEYNETHKRMFGASMAAIENYFPLKILANARIDKEEDVNQPNRPDGITTKTGSIIKRRVNNLALDITGADALSVILDHITQMEHWSAYAEWNRDLNTLRTYKRFRNQVINMTSVYGGGRKLWENFNDLCLMAAGEYRPPIAKLDKSAVNIAKGVTAAKVSFRMFTALKQLLSAPAYAPEVSISSIAKSIVNPYGDFKWCMDNLPIFRERWESRISGDPRLLKNDKDWAMWRSRVMEISQRIGMTPNAFVDALTVSIGARAMYDTRLKQYLKEGYPADAAEKRAKEDATILFNQTQQSSESPFLSTMQVDRSWLSVLFTVFRNSAMSYTRQEFDALRNLKRNLAPGQRSESVEFMTKQMLRDWDIDPDTATDVERDKAENAAQKRFRRQIKKDAIRLATFGFILEMAWNLGAYLPYIIFGDDDDEKDKMWDDAFTHAMFGSVEGLTGGDVMSSFGNMAASGEWNFNQLTKDMPLASDINTIANKFIGSKNAEAVSDIINLIVQSGIGMNPQSITDAAVAITDACGDEPALSHEAAIFVMRVLQVPQSQLDKMYFDEIGLSGEEASKLTPEQLAQRYATYKVKRGTPLAPWSWDDEERQSKYQKIAEKRIKERLGSQGNSEDIEAYDALAERYNAVQKKVSAAKNLMNENYFNGMEAYAQLEDEPDFELYQNFRELDKDFNRIAKMYMTAETPEAATLIRDALPKYRSLMVKTLQAPTYEDGQKAYYELQNLMYDFDNKITELQPTSTNR